MDCTVVIPVGPGHEELAGHALQSVMLASQEPGGFEAVHVLVGDDTQGKTGRSAMRNRLVWGTPDGKPNGKAEPGPDIQIFSTTSDGDEPPAVFASDWLFFLDADDILCSPGIFGESAFAVVEPYLTDFDAVWGTIHELHPGGKVMRRRQTDRITTYSAFVKTPPALGCQMGHFVRREAFREVGGFNAELDVCEDVDLYLREWKGLRCIKQEKPLFLNRRGAHTWLQPTGEGERVRHTGREWSMRAEEMMKAAREALS